MPLTFTTRIVRIESFDASSMSSTSFLTALYIRSGQATISRLLRSSTPIEIAGRAGAARQSVGAEAGTCRCPPIPGIIDIRESVAVVDEAAPLVWAGKTSLTSVATSLALAYFSGRK